MLGFLYSSCTSETTFNLSCNLEYVVFFTLFVVLLPEVTINYRHGLPVITLTLPTRRERCQFAVKPMVATVGAFLKDVRREDKGIVKAEVFTTGIFHSCLSSVDVKRNS